MAIWKTCESCLGTGYVECLKCLGTGADIDTDKLCRHCLGDGAFDCTDCEAAGGWFEEEEDED